ncbi:PEP-CTERM sorting domain-containing protein [Kiritimatiellaeota bacterium B1221]|nr:PEP-CTERM sorting domain-containing protein [Kiritimatiellaeota bacterium B1221]
MKKIRFTAVLIAAFCLTAHLQASSITSFADITNWVGSGANQAGFVIDFNDGTTNQSYAWGFRWDGSQTGEDMFQAIVAADPNLTATASNSGFGFYVSSITYNDEVDLHTSDLGANGGTADEWWTYYTADGSSTLPAAWTASATGADTRTLANNSWDGWSATVDNAWPGSTPDSPLNAVPEPSAIVLLLAGVGLLSWARKSLSSKA